MQLLPFIPLIIPIDGDENNKKWVLILAHGIGPHYSSVNEYLVGDFDGKTFICNSDPSLEKKKWMDFGRDHYAAVTWSNSPRPLTIAWMNSWSYAGVVPTSQYRSAMSVVRELSLFSYNGEVYLASSPVVELESLRREKVSVASFNVKENHTIGEIKNINNNGLFELDIDLTLNSANCVGLLLQNEKGEAVKISFNRRDDKIYVDRTKSGLVNFSNYFPCVTNAPLWGEDRFNLRIYVDKSSVEVFLNGGKSAITNTLFPSAPYNKITFYTEDEEFGVDKFDYYCL